MRYAWALFDDYFGKMGFLPRALIRATLSFLRKWDLKTNAGVDRFVAISQHVKDRIKKFYGRDAEVIYPPVDTDYFTPDPSALRGEEYLIVSALVPYKNVELAVRAFKKMKKSLRVIGDGPERAALERQAGPGIVFMGWQPDEVLRSYYRGAKALIFPGEEDFGIVPVEMQACGGSVIGYARGGLLETVKPGQTGEFFSEPTEESLIDAVTRFERSSKAPDLARQNALRFNRERFKREIMAFVDRTTTAPEACRVC
jgi:glycosyltransferase involved in cell wall biosynthesis